MCCYVAIRSWKPTFCVRKSVEKGLQFVTVRLRPAIQRERERERERERKRDRGRGSGCGVLSIILAQGPIGIGLGPWTVPPERPGHGAHYKAPRTPGEL